MSCGVSSSASGPEALLDTESRAYRDAGLGYLRMDRKEMAERLLANAALLRLPLIRSGNELSVGSDEATWKRIATADQSTP